MVALVVPDAPVAPTQTIAATTTNTPPTPTPTPPNTINAPELGDAAYFNEVLRLPAEKSEAQLNDELVSRAQQLGILTSTATSANADETTDKRFTSSAQSASTAVTYHARAFSTGSDGSAGTDLTNQSSDIANAELEAPSPQQAANSNGHGSNKKTTITATTTKELSFGQYDKYLAQIDRNLDQPKFRKSAAPTDPSSKSVFSVTSRRSIFSVKSGIKDKIKWRRKSIQPFVPTLSCVCCRDDYSKSSALHNLPCGHTYCGHCLRVMINQATTEEPKFPPRCCTQPIPGSIVKDVLTRANQHAFLKAVAQFSTPWEARLFCPNKSCGEFIPPRHKIDPKHPFDVTCRKCHHRVCVMCKRNAHPVGKDCPEDWELATVLKMGEKSGWRRCYKCRNLVELAQGCTHMTCRCKAQFCYICGGVWDSTVGCPNVCNGEEELERRRLEEEERLAKAEAEKEAQEAAEAAASAERKKAQERSRNHSDFKALLRSQQDDMTRFREFESATRSKLGARQISQRMSVIEKHDEQVEKIKERHAKTTSHLEDRQVTAEMELRTTLDQSERSVRIRLKHMEAYCDGLGRNPSSDMPNRTVTERDLRELGQQYNLRDNMERLHQSKINVMRDRQAKQMEELVERQTAELAKLAEKRQADLEDLAGTFADETDVVNQLFKERRERLQQRWELSMRILCKDLEAKEGVKYGELPFPEWPDEPAQAADEEPAQK